MRELENRNSFCARSKRKSFEMERRKRREGKSSSDTLASGQRREKPEKKKKTNKRDHAGRRDRSLEGRKVGGLQIFGDLFYALTNILFEGRKENRQFEKAFSLSRDYLRGLKLFRLG